jgi:ribosomal protein L37AE/L43A
MRHCATCNKEFVPRQYDHQYCCDHCRWTAHNREKIEAVRVYRELVRQAGEAAE